MQKLSLNEIMLIHKFDYKEEKAIIDTLYLWQNITRNQYLEEVQNLSNKAALKDFMVKAGMCEVKYYVLRCEEGNTKRCINKMVSYRLDHIKEYSKEEQRLINYAIDLIVETFC